MADTKELPYCDVIMKGGITSGVVYPEALVRLSRKYRFKSIGGASAGAIGAALGAAAEHNRAGGGFDSLRNKTNDLADGGLKKLFQPQASTRPLLPIMIAAAGFGSDGKKRTGGTAAVVIGTILGQYWRWSVPLFLLALALGLGGGLLFGWTGAALGALLGALLLVGLVVWRVLRTLTHAVPLNSFGICTGIGTDGPGFTDWLAASIDECAGRDPDGPPLTFGHLWRGQTASTEVAAASDAEARQRSEVAELDPASRQIDLRMITTCLSHGSPYELPFDTKNLFFDVEEWKTLFPARVVDALLSALPAQPAGSDDAAERRHDLAARQQGMRRLPIATDFPVFVAVRMSLSFPLLISAIPLYEIDFAAKGRGVTFRKLWFTDGGLVSNFPLHLFDEALPAHPSFAINLDRFGKGQTRDTSEAKNVDVPKTNASRLPSYAEIHPVGFAAVKDFAARALSTARGWQDNSYLNVPGYRDRIARVFQTPEEGGINLYMDGDSVARLGKRGGAAADALIKQFEGEHYANDRTGWDNHRWIRYRALIAAMAPFAESYAAGRAQLKLPKRYPSYPATRQEAAVMTAVDAAMASLRKAFDADAAADVTITDAPKPLSRLRRTSR